MKVPRETLIFSTFLFCGVSFFKRLFVFFLENEAQTIESILDNVHHEESHKRHSAFLFMYMYTKLCEFGKVRPFFESINRDLFNAYTVTAHLT